MKVSTTWIAHLILASRSCASSLYRHHWHTSDSDVIILDPVQRNSTLNFTRDFSDDTARVAFDMSVSSIEKVLSTNHVAGLDTR